MPNSIPLSTLVKFTTFGDMLRFLRRRAGLTQLEFAMAVGYSDSQISRLEQNMRLPDPVLIEARFVSILHLEDEPVAVVRLLELAASVRREDSPALGMSPYKGLDYFDETDADLFVGREVLVEKLARRVLALLSKREAAQGRFIAIVGASGSGKSSLVRAGLVSALRWDKTSSGWSIHILTPTAHPLESLAFTLTRETISLSAAAVLMDDLAADPRALNLHLKRQLKANTAGYFLLVVDQFEELFTLCRSEDERSAFIGNLMAAAMETDGRGIVVITLRSDFYTHCAAYPQLRQASASHQEYIGAMSTDEMRRAVEEPAQRGRWELEPGLVDLILHDVGHEPGALPLLSHALLETWHKRRGRTLTLSGYTSSGGVRRAIAETAETVFTDQFTLEQQAIARRIFLRLTDLGDETSTGDTRRRATYTELILNPDEAEATRYVLKALADARLVTAAEDSVQVAHEALIREWPTLRGWLEENRAGLRLHRQLTEAAQEWDSAGRQSDLLYRGGKLAQAHEWSVPHADDLNTLEKEFLETALASSENEVAERQAQQQRELEAAQKLADFERQRAQEGIKTARRLRRRSILVSVVGALALLLAVFAIVAWRRAAAQAAINQGMVLAGAAQQANQTGQGDLALALALEAVKLNDRSLDSLKVLRSVALGGGTRMLLNSQVQEVKTLALSPDAQTAILGSCASLDSQNVCLTGELALWDLASAKQLRRWSAHSGWVTAVAFSSDGQTLISGGQDGSLFQWNLDGTPVRQLVGHKGSITGLIAVPATNYVLSGSADGYLILWDMSNGYVVQRFTATFTPITALALTGDGLQAVSAHQDGSLRLWSLNSKEPVNVVKGEGADIRQIAVSPDGRWILYTDNSVSDLSLTKVNALDGSLLDQLKLDCVPGQMVLSPDGSYAFITCATSILQMDIPGWTVYRRLLGHGEIFNALSFNRDGRLGLSASNDGTLRLWNLTDQLDYQIKKVDVDTLNSLAITSDGKYLVLNDYYQNGFEGPALWDISTSEVGLQYFGGIFSINPGGVSISPDNRYIAVVGIYKSDATSVMEIWDKENQAVRCVKNDFTGNAKALALSPDNLHMLIGTQVSAESTGQLFYYDVQSCQVVTQFGTLEDVADIAFNSDGTRAITGSSLLGRVILWDVTTGKEIRRFSSPANEPASSVAFGPGDATVLGSGLGEIYVWDLNTADLLKSYTGLSSFPRSLAVSSDGRVVLSGTAGGELILWDFSSGEELHRINTHLAITDVLFSPDGKKAYAAALEGKLIEISIDEKSLADLLNWIKENRYVPDLTCAQRQQYHLDPQCRP